MQKNYFFFIYKKANANTMPCFRAHKRIRCDSNKL